MFDNATLKNYFATSKAGIGYILRGMSVHDLTFSIPYSMDRGQEWDFNAANAPIQIVRMVADILLQYRCLARAKRVTMRTTVARSNRVHEPWPWQNLLIPAYQTMCRRIHGLNPVKSLFSASVAHSARLSQSNFASLSEHVLSSIKTSCGSNARLTIVLEDRSLLHLLWQKHARFGYVANITTSKTKRNTLVIQCRRALTTPIYAS